VVPVPLLTERANAEADRLGGMKPWRAQADEMLNRLEAEDHPEEFFHALRDLLAERYRRGPGKPKGTQVVDDTARLERIFDLLRFGEVDDADEAVRRVAADDPGDSEVNTRKRLRRKLPQVLERLDSPEEREKAEILRKAFEEDVEQWDL